VVDLDHNVEPRQLCTPVKLITQTWSGRGKQPLWFVQALKKRDTTAESLLIDGGAKAVKKGAAKKLAKTAAKKKA
jgi:DNA-binding protein H-NS